MMKKIELLVRKKAHRREGLASKMDLSHHLKKI